MIAVVAGALFVALAIGALRLHPFLALVLGAILTGALTPSDAAGGDRLLAALDQVGTDFGEVVGAIGIAIALAAVIGDCLLRSGAADRIASALLAAFGARRAPWALAAAGYVLSVPVFFDTVFFLLIPLALALAKRAPGRYPLFVAAICAGAVATHSLVPPTPGPLGMADELGLPLGTAVAFGLALGVIPVAVALLVARRCLRPTGPPADPGPVARPGGDRPGLLLSLLPVVLPVALMSAASALAASGLSDSAPGARWILALGHRNAALLVAAAAAAAVVWKVRRPRVRDLFGSFGGAIAEAGPIILITAAGGAFGRALAGTGIAESLAGLPGEGGGVVLLLLAAGIAAVLKVAQGSGTVAILTGSAIVTSVVGDLSSLAFHPGYLFAAVGFGSMIASWMNDSGFWVVGRMAGFGPADTFRAWSATAAAVGVVGLVQVVVLAAIFPLG